MNFSHRSVAQPRILQESCSDNTLVTQLSHNVDNSRQVGISNKQARPGRTAQHKAHLQCVGSVQHDLWEQRDHNVRLSDPGPSPNKMQYKSDRSGKENDEHGFRVKRLSSRSQPPGFGATLTISNDAHNILIGPPSAAARYPGSKSPKPHTNQKYASARTKDQEHTHNHTGHETQQHTKTQEQCASRSTSQQHTASCGTILEHLEVSGKTIGTPLLADNFDKSAVNAPPPQATPSQPVEIQEPEDADLHACTDREPSSSSSNSPPYHDRVPSPHSNILLSAGKPESEFAGLLPQCRAFENHPATDVPTDILCAEQSMIPPSAVPDASARRIAAPSVPPGDELLSPQRPQNMHVLLKEPRPAAKSSAGNDGYLVSDNLSHMSFPDQRSLLHIEDPFVVDFVSKNVQHSKTSALNISHPAAGHKSAITGKDNVQNNQSQTVLHTNTTASIVSPVQVNSVPGREGPGFRENDSGIATTANSTHVSNCFYIHRCLV